MFDYPWSLVFWIFFTVWGAAGLIVYAIGRKKNRPAFKSKDPRAMILYDILFYSIASFMIAYGLTGIITRFIYRDNSVPLLMIGAPCFAFGAAGLVVYWKRRKGLAEFDDKRFYDILSFIISGGLVILGLVLSVQSFND